MKLSPRRAAGGPGRALPGGPGGSKGERVARPPGGRPPRPWCLAGWKPGRGLIRSYSGWAGALETKLSFGSGADHRTQATGAGRSSPATHARLDPPIIGLRAKQLTAELARVRRAQGAGQRLRPGPSLYGWAMHRQRLDSARPTTNPPGPARGVGP